MAENNITVLMSSCDRYADAWEPFFRLRGIFWKDCALPTVICSETIEYTGSAADVTTYCGGKGVPWTRIMKKCLKSIETEYVLLCLEDYFFQSDVDTEVLDAAVKQMEEDKNVGVIQFAIDIHTRYDESRVVGSYFSPVPKYERSRQNGRIYCVLSLYRREYLKKLLWGRESPWEFEIYGSLRSRFYGETVLREREDHPRCFDYYIDPKTGYGISRGKWLPKNRELFERYGIEVDFSALGTLEGEEYERFVDKYYGRRRADGEKKESHTTLEKLTLPFRSPREFAGIVARIIKKRSAALKMKVKLLFPFLP